MATNPTPKTFTYHVSKNGVFKGLLTNVISDFSRQVEINSAGSTISIVLGVAADNFGEGSLVDFNNEIDVYAIDDQVPNGLLIFKGFIVNYKPIYSDTNQEQVVLTVMGYGATLNDYMIETGESLDVNSPTQNSAYTLAAALPHTTPQSTVIQSFTTGAAVTKLSSLQLTLAALQPSDVGATIQVSVYLNHTDAKGQTSIAPAIAVATMPITSQIPSTYRFTFASIATVVAATQYFIQIRNLNDGAPDTNNTYGVNLYYDNTSPLAGQTLEQGQLVGTFTAISGSAYLLTYSSTGSTTSAYNSQDPSVILKSILDNYVSQGGQVNYTGASIDLTGTSVSYTFNTNTTLEGIQKCLQMAPTGWYFYIDEATNLLHFHKAASTPSHYLTLGKNIKNLAVEKRAQDLVNVVYFVGGPTAGVNLFNKYVLQTSVNLYGRHALRYTDNNVTVSSTAQIIANSILSNQGGIELRIDLDILDNAGDANSILGFNIESIVLGESISFRSLGAGLGGSLWDVAFWDVAKWDFDITDLTSVIVQVTKINYTPDVLSLSLSTVPPDITKRVQDIYRNLTQVNTLSNPATPS